MGSFHKITSRHFPTFKKHYSTTKDWWANLKASTRTIIKLLPFFVILMAIPLTVNLSQKQQTINSNASSACTRNVTLDSTGGTDVTSALQTFIDQSPNGSVICFTANGKYSISNQIHIANRSNLTLEGNGATIFKSTRGNSPIILIDQGGTAIKFHNVTVKGVNPRPGKWEYDYEHEHGFAIGGTANVDLDTVNIINVGGDGVYISGTTVGSVIVPSTGAHIHNSLFDGIGRMGVAFTDGANDAVIDFNTFRNIGYYTWDIEPNGYGVGGVNIRISDNTIGTKPFGDYPSDPTQALGYVFVVTGTSGGGPADNVEISRNTMTDPAMGYFYIGVFNNGGLRRNIRVINNTAVKRIAGPAMLFEGVDGVTVTGNTQPLSSGSLTSTPGSTNLMISNNVTNGTPPMPTSAIVTPTPTTINTPMPTSTNNTPTPTAATDITPPTISAITVNNITKNGATISWNLSEPATGQIEYGTTTAYGNLSKLEANYLTFHSQDLTGLAAGTTYHYRIMSKDNAVNIARSADKTFTTTVAVTPTPTPKPTSTTPTPIVTGDGILGMYYPNTNLSGVPVYRVDQNINFNWNRNSPINGIPRDRFSARWSGFIKPQYTQNYTFYATVDDGVRVWVNNVLIIDKWSDHSKTEFSGSISLNANQKYEIRVEYYENGGNALMQLRWSSPSTPKAIIPQSRFYTYN